MGYGLQQVNAAFSTSRRIRMVAHPQLLQINTGFTGPQSLLLSNNANTCGTCFGDSGGPNYLGTGTVVAGVTSFGLNGSCGGTGGVSAWTARGADLHQRAPQLVTGAGGSAAGSAREADAQVGLPRLTSDRQSGRPPSPTIDVS